MGSMTLDSKHEATIWAETFNMVLPLMLQKNNVHSAVYGVNEAVCAADALVDAVRARIPKPVFKTINEIQNRNDDSYVEPGAMNPSYLELLAQRAILEVPPMPTEADAPPLEEDEEE